MPILALNVHAGYECRHSGACCTAGWPIPVEADAASRIRSDGRLPGDALLVTGMLPDGAAAVIVPAPDGACPFFEPEGSRLCAIQRRLGHSALPASCRHFPRVALLEPDAVRVTLSHFCPTAAWMLFGAQPARLAVVADAAGIADRQEHSGFDARHTIPPLLRPGVAMDAATCRLWEGYMLDALDTSSLTAEDALAGIAFSAGVVRDWSAGPETLETLTRKALAAAPAATRPIGRWRMNLSDATRLFRLATGSIPAGLSPPDVPENAEAADRAWVLPGWAHVAGPHARTLGRYLAVRSFGAWSAYLGEGIRTQVAMLAVALAVVRVEAVRETARACRPLDQWVLHAAIRSADLLLHHLSETAALVRSLAEVERGPLSASLAFMGLEAAG